MAVHFPADQLHVLDYNRVVADLNGLEMTPAPGLTSDFSLTVRAIATVYWAFLRPFWASFWIGSRVDLRFRSRSMPPPWIMKPLMTRWNTVPS